MIECGQFFIGIFFPMLYKPTRKIFESNVIIFISVDTHAFWYQILCVAVLFSSGIQMASAMAKPYWTIEWLISFCKRKIRELGYWFKHVFNITNSHARTNIRLIANLHNMIESNSGIVFLLNSPSQLALVRIENTLAEKAILLTISNEFLIFIVQLDVMG